MSGGPTGPTDFSVGPAGRSTVGPGPTRPDRPVSFLGRGPADLISKVGPDHYKFIDTDLKIDLLASPQKPNSVPAKTKQRPQQSAAAAESSLLADPSRFTLNLSAKSFTTFVMICHGNNLYVVRNDSCMSIITIIMP